MKKNYVFIIFIIFMYSFCGYSQGVKTSIGTEANTTIEGLSIYPNPVNNGKLFVNSKLSLEKEIQIFDVLGKKVFEIITNNKEINISNVMPGVYIIRIREKEASATRKLIVK
ncbi:MAG TPA: T9SS C-terminal target domain-containing protein [Flavobacterium sp.]|nr:T9SS C-terminal target domain-containing protein [Flavobacterium sp.]